MSLADFVLVNGWNRTHESPLEFSIDQLGAPIVNLAVLPYRFPPHLMEFCSGGGQFQDEFYKGKKNFCIRFTHFPSNAIAHIILLFEQDSTPVILKETIFIGPPKNQKLAQPIQLAQVLAEHRQTRVMNYIYWVFVFPSG